MNARMNFALRQYRQIGVQCGITDASPHHLVQMLMAGALEKMAVAKGNIERKETAEKGRNTGIAISIIDGLRSSLDMKNGGEIAQNLQNLYDYMMRLLVEANFHNDVVKLDEAASLLSALKSAWEAIPEAYRTSPANSAT